MNNYFVTQDSQDVNDFEAFTTKEELAMWLLRYDQQKAGFGRCDGFFQPWQVGMDGRRKELTGYGRLTRAKMLDAVINGDWGDNISVYLSADDFIDSLVCQNL